MLSLIDRAYNGEYNSLLVFNLYKDIEYCYKELLDYENAYKYSTKRLSMIEGFKS